MGLSLEFYTPCLHIADFPQRKNLIRSNLSLNMLESWFKESFSKEFVKDEEGVKMKREKKGLHKNRENNIL